MATVNELLGEWTGWKDQVSALQKSVDTLKQANAATTTEANGYQERIKALETQLASANADLSTAKQTIGTLQSSNTKLDADLKAAQESAKSAAADAEKAKGSVPTEAAKLAAKTVAGLGLSTPVPNDPAANAPALSALEQFNAMKDPVARGIFYREHEAEILGYKKS